MSRSRSSLLRLFVLLALSAPASPPAHAQGHGGGLAVSETFRMPEGEKRVTVPFTRAGEHIILSVSVNGGPPGEFVFDTGMPSPGVLLYASAAVDSLHLPYGPVAIRVGGAGGAAPVEARLASGVGFRVGGLEVGNSIAIVMPPTPAMSGLHDGIIGATLFQNFIVHVDQDAQTLTLTPREGWTPPAGAVEVPLEVAGRRAYVEARVTDATGAAKPVRLVLDLGATHAVSLNRHSAAGLVAPEPSLATVVGRGMSGPITGRVARIARFELGGQRFERVVATFPDSAFENPSGMDSRDGNLGAGLLGRFNLTLDLPGKRMFVTPNRRAAEPFEWDMSGARFEVDDAHRPVVANVLAGSPAAEAGLVPGEVLLRLDGKAIDPRQLMRERDAMRTPGRVLALRVRDAKGREREVQLTLRRLL